MSTGLGGTFKIGNASASSLVKSAATLQNELNTYNDTIQKITYENSAKTASDLQAYQTYLQGRVSTLNSTGSLTDITKAANLSQEIITATHGNISADIQRENISIMAGNATPTDKLNLISSEFSRALGVGDQALAQTLESQAYSLQQTIEQTAQTAADSAATLAKSNASTAASGQQSVATQISDQIKQLNADVGAGGMADLNKNLKGYVTAHKAQYTALANQAGLDPTVKAAILKAVNTSQPNYQDLVAGSAAAQISAHLAAGNVEAPYDPATAQNYYDQASNIANGSTKVDTLAGSMTLQDLQNWQANPAMFVPTEDANKGVLTFSYGGNAKAAGSSAISGYKFNAQGQVTANFTGQATGTQVTQQQVSLINNTLQKLGVSFKQVSSTTDLSNGIAVQFNGKVPKWLQPVTAGQSNLKTNVYLQPNGSLELATLDQGGKGHVYAVATDATGKHAVYEGTPDKNGDVVYGKQNAKGDYGFNQNDNTIVQQGKIVLGGQGMPLTNNEKGVMANSSFGLSNLKNNVESWLGMRSGNAQQLVNQSQQTLAKIQQAKAAQQAVEAAQFKASQIVAPLPTINMPKPQAAPVIKINAPAIAMPKPVGTQALGQNAAGTTGLQTANGGVSLSGGMPGGAAGLY